MAVDPNTLDDPQLLRNLMENARRQGVDDLVMRCQVRIAQLAGQEFETPIDREFWTALAAAEEMATARNNKKTRLTRTRQKEKRVGVHQCLVDWAMEKAVTDGFVMLVEGGHPELTGEAIVVRHSARFPADVVEHATAKLEKHGIDVASLGVAN